MPGAVALTFDDGPWPVQTRRVLAVLRRMRAPATFFVVGDLAEHFPRLIAAERSQPGILVEDHSWTHPLVPPFGEQRPRTVRFQIARTLRTLTAEHVHATLFRPPGGGWSDRVVAIASSLHVRLVLWSVDPARLGAGRDGEEHHPQRAEPRRGRIDRDHARRRRQPHRHDPGAAAHHPRDPQARAAAGERRTVTVPSKG